MTQSFAGTALDGPGSIVNFGDTRPAQVMDVPVQIINSNSRTSGIVRIDGNNSVPFTGAYTILTGTTPGGQATEYAIIKAKEGVVGVLINGSQTVQNVCLVRVSLSQSLGGGALRCNLVFELLDA